MFSQACVKNSVHHGGGVAGACGAGEGHAWGEGGHGWQGCVWQEGHAWQGGGCAWQGGACVAGEMATAADGTHPTGMHSCL